MTYMTQHTRRFAIALIIVLCRTMPGPALVGAVLGLALTGQAAFAETVNIPVPKAAVVTAFNTALSGTRVKVHNFGARKNWSWLDNRSYVLSPTGARTNFQIPEYSYKVTKAGRTLKYYVHDFNSSSLNAYVDGSHIKLVVKLEGQGEEIAARCIRRAGPAWNRHWKECSLNMERDIQLNNARIEVSAVPTAYDGSLSYKSPRAKFRADIKIANKLCRTFNGICGHIEGKIRDSLYPAVQNSLLGILKRSDLKQRVADGVRKALAGKIDPSWKVTNVRSSGNNFIITAQRPDQIDGKSVRMLSLKPVKTRNTVTCPDNVPLKATINTKYAMKGTGWLEHENSKKSKTFQWKTPKPGTVVSATARRFNGKAGDSYKNRWSKMVVRWKGVDGKTHTKTSAAAKYNVKCSLAATGTVKFR